MKHPSSSELTPFQRAEIFLDTWDGQGTPLERALYRNKTHGVSALVDPFTTRRHGVVIYNHRAAAAGESGHLAALRPSERLALTQVAHAIGGGMLRAIATDSGLVEISRQHGEQRVIERVDGFAVPRQAHLSLGIAYRGEEPLQGRRSEEELEATLALLQLTDREALQLDQALDTYAVVSRLIEQDGPDAALKAGEGLH